MSTLPRFSAPMFRPLRGSCVISSKKNCAQQVQQVEALRIARDGVKEK